MVYLMVSRFCCNKNINHSSCFLRCLNSLGDAKIKFRYNRLSTEARDNLTGFSVFMCSIEEQAQQADSQLFLCYGP